MAHTKKRTPPKAKREKLDKRRILMAVLAILMAVLLLLPMITMILPAAGAVSEDELRAQIGSLKGSATDVKAKIDALQADLNAVKGRKDQAIQEKALRDQELAYIEEQIDNTVAQIAYYDELIVQKEGDLVQAQDREKAQYELFCRRLRAMEEGGVASYWSVLFSASSFSELLSRAVDVQDIMDYDNAVIDQLKADRQAVADSLAALEEVQAEQQSQKEALDRQREEQAVKVEEANQVIKNLEADAAEYQRLLDAEKEEEDRVNAAIAQKQKELEEKIRQNQIKFAVSGDWMWPLPSSYLTLTSAFGYRIHPITGRPHSHTGVDIAAAGGTKIRSVKNGVVTISSYGNSYGNYVVVDHGDGTSSLYAHMSSRAVSEGAIVSQGDVLGYVGSTGSSTANHLHLEIRVNGQRTDPEKYWPNLPFYRRYNE